MGSGRGMERGSSDNCTFAQPASISATVKRERPCGRNSFRLAEGRCFTTDCLMREFKVQRREFKAICVRRAANS